MVPLMTNTNTRGRDSKGRPLPPSPRSPKLVAKLAKHRAAIDAKAVAK